MKNYLSALKYCFENGEFVKSRDKFIDIIKIANTMNLIEKIDCDDTCHFEIWRK